MFIFTIELCIKGAAISPKAMNLSNHRYTADHKRARRKGLCT
jgi:hypothetical protein